MSINNFSVHQMLLNLTRRRRCVLPVGVKHDQVKRVKKGHYIHRNSRNKVQSLLFQTGHFGGSSAYCRNPPVKPMVTASDSSLKPPSAAEEGPAEEAGPAPL